MAEPSQWVVDTEYLVTRVGVVAAVLAGVLWFHFHEFSTSRRQMNWNQQRMIRNERSMMQKMGIAITLDSDTPPDGREAK